MSGSGNKRFEVGGERIRCRAPTMSGYSCGGFALSIVDICKKLREWTRAQARDSAIYSGWICKSQFLDPAGNFTLVVSRLLPAALDRYPRGLTGHVAVPNRSILR
jgi:hypothetical protein